MIRKPAIAFGGIGVLGGMLCLAALAWGWEQESPAQGKPVPASRVRVLDLRRAILLCDEGKKATEELNKRVAARNAEIEKRQKELQDLQKQAESGADPEKRAESAALFERRARDFNRLKEDYAAELQEAESEMINRVGKTIVTVLDTHARQQGYDLVLHTAQQGSVLWWPPSMDITEEVVAAVNRAGASKPASPGPAGPASGAPK
jgi:Skp family chaperone for outer membrane proteins